MIRHSAKPVYRKSFGGFGGTLNELDLPSELPDEDVIESTNWRIWKNSKSRIKRPGFEKHDAYYDFGTDAVRGIFDYEDADGVRRGVVATDKKIFVWEPTTPEWVEVYSQDNAISKPVKMVAYESGRPIVVGYDKNLTIEADASYELGTDKPDTKLTSADSGGAGLPDGKYKYVFTFYRSGNFPCESNPSPESTEVTVVTNKIDLTDILVSADPKINCRRIYRTTAGGAIFYWLADIDDNVTTVYEDNLADDSLGDEVSYDRGKPPVADSIEVWDERLWLTVNSENMLYFTNTGEAEEMAAKNFLPIKAREADNLTTVKAFEDILYIFKHKTTFQLEKVGVSSYALSVKFDSIGCDSAASVAVSGGIMLWKSMLGIEVFNGYTIFRPIPSRYIWVTMDDISRSNVDKIYGEIYEEESEYWLAIPTKSTEPDKIVIFNFLEKKFYIYKSYYEITCFHNIKDDAEWLTFALGSSGGDFFTFNEGEDDNGHAIEARFQSKWFSVCGEKERWNIIRRVFVHFVAIVGKKITLNMYRDFRTDPSATIELEGAYAHESIKRINLGLRCTHVAFEFINNDKINGKCVVVNVIGYFKKRMWKKDIMGEVEHE